MVHMLPFWFLHEICLYVLRLQPVKQLRPPMSEVVESLEALYQKFNIEKSDVADGTEVDPFERSFHSTNICFMGSPPAVSHASA